jgi:SET domain-containing protein
MRMDAPQPVRSMKTVRAVSAASQCRIFQRLLTRASPYKLRAVRSSIHGLGVRAGENIPAGRRVIEYAGERIGRAEARRRFLQGSPGRPRGFNYLAQLDSYWTIDGGASGNGAELINHCCEPNLELRKVSGRLWLFSLRTIRAGEELGYDYKFAKKGKRALCRCGAANCRGTINLQ